MSDTATIAIVGALSGGIGALLQYVAARQTSAASIASDRRKDERAEKDDFIKLLQTENGRIAAERDRYLAQLLADRDLMHEGSRIIETATQTLKQEATP